MRNPAVLKAARFAAGLTVASAAAALNVEASEVVAWEESGTMSEDPQAEADRYHGLCAAMDSRVGSIVRDLIERNDVNSKARFADWVIEIGGLMGLQDDQLVSIGQRIVDRTQLVRQRPALPESAGHRLIEEFRLDSPALAAELAAIQRKKITNCMTFDQVGDLGAQFKKAMARCGLRMSDCVGTTLTYWSIDDDFVEDKKQCNCTAVSYVIDKSGILVTAINRVVRHLKPGAIQKFHVSSRGLSGEWIVKLEQALRDGIK